MKQGSLYNLVILNQKLKKNSIKVALQTMHKNTTCRIYLNKLTRKSLATVSPIVKYVFSI